jgi:hypothetical protein
MRDYTLSETFAPTQIFDIPAFGGKLDVSWNPESQVTPWGGLAYFVSYLKTSGLFDRLVEDAPFHYTSPNAPDVRDVVGTTVLAIICGFTRYVHINRLRNDTVLATLLGLGHIVSEDSVRRALKAADEQELNAWLARHEKDVFDKLLEHQYVLDIDNTVKPIFGHQEGAQTGYNPQKPGRPSHNFHSYFIGSIRISLGVDVQSGKRHSGSCSMPRLWEIIDNLSDEKKPRLLRGDVGYGGDENMCEAERRDLKYLFKLRRTKTVFALFRRHENGHGWSSAEDGWEAMESTIQLSGWGKARRCILLRRPSKDVKRIAMATQPRRRGRPKKNALMLVQTEFDFVEDKVGRYWDCCALVTNDEDLDAASLQQVYRDRGDCENNFDEYKNQYGWGGFVTKDLKPCRAIARLIAIVANWWNIFCRLADGDRHLEPTTSRPMYMGIVGRLVVSGRKRLLRLTSTHLKATEIQSSLMRIGEFMKRISAIAEQLDFNRVWELIILTAFRKWLGGNRAKDLLPSPLTLIG